MAVSLERRRAGQIRHLGHVLATGLALAILACFAPALTGCGGDGSSPDRSADRQALQDYLARVQPIRLGTNKLLDGADPILSAYDEGALNEGQAERRVNDLERRFADFTVRIAEVEPVPAAIAHAHRSYAHTYVYEDAYLSALAAAVPERKFDDLPDTKDRQRAAIIAWRTRLEVLADRYGLDLPENIQVAGRGEIAPSPVGD